MGGTTAALLDTSQDLTSAMIAGLPWSVAVWRPDGSTAVNGRFVDLFGTADPASLPGTLATGARPPWRPDGADDEHVVLDDGRQIAVHRSTTVDGAVITIQIELASLQMAPPRMRSETQLVSILENISDGVLLIDAEGRVIEYNRRMLSLYGIDHRQVYRGMPFEAFNRLSIDLTHLEPERREAEVARRKAFALDPSRRFTLRQLFTGETFEVSKEITPDNAAVITVRDITEVLRQARALEEERRREQYASQHKSRFMARMSHEMRTPLNGVLGIAALLDRSELDTQQRALLAAIRDSGSVLLRLIDDLLDSTRLDTMDFELQARPFVICDVVHETLQIIAPEANKRGLEIRKAPSGAKLPAIVGDAVRLKQVLLNLLSNAVKFTDEGSITVGLDARIVGQEAEVALFVEDTGIGISADDLERIFEQFEQVSTERAQLMGGVGLGLSIARRMVEAMAGRLTVTSTLGKGSRFTIHVTLPLASEDVA